MAQTKTISVDLGTKQPSLQRHLDSGRYQTASEVLQDALDALDERSAADDEWLRAKVAASMANTKPSVPIDIVFERLEARHARNVKGTKRGA